MLLNIIDFGAVGDGVTMNTEAFRRVCAAAEANGEPHNVILVPPGVFVSGTISLPSNVTLRLEAGAVLKASANPDDFQPNPFIFPRRDTAEGTNYDYLALYFIGSLNCENISLEGGGIIDGNGTNYWEDVCYDGEPWIENNPTFPVNYRVLKAKPRRFAMVVFWKCRNVALRDLTLVNAPAYTVWPQGCDDVRIQDITIRNPYQGPNTDALDIDCSENVIISGCNIAAGDDCIAVKSDTSRLGEDRPSRQLVVTNCVFSSTACAIRLGYEGDGAITDCVFSNIVIYDTHHGIDMLSLTPCTRPDFKTGTPIECIQFSCITMRNVAHPFFIWCGTENEKQPYSAAVKNLTFSDRDIRARGGSFIGSKDGSPVRNVAFRNVRIHLAEHSFYDGQKCIAYPNLWGTVRLPDVLRFHRVESCRLDAVELTRLPANDGQGECLAWTETTLDIDSVRQASSGKA